MAEVRDLHRGEACSVILLVLRTTALCRQTQGDSQTPFVCYGVRMSVRTNLLLPAELVAEVDAVAGPRNRSRYVAEALRARLRADRLRSAVAATAGVLRTEDYPAWQSPEGVAAWVRARREERTDPGSAS